MDPTNYLTIISIFPRLLGIIYFFCFGSFIFQIRGLIGSDGILPITQFLHFVKRRWDKRAYYYVPSVFWLNSSDIALMSVVWGGTILSILLIFGIAPAIILPILFILHLSIVSTGQDFLSFGWESFFLEITFNTIFLIWSSPPNPFSWISLNLLLFRFYFQAGVSKIYSRDVNWRNLTAIWHHYQSQPIPNTTAWYVYRLPLWFHKASTAAMFFVELIVPFGIFAPEEIRLVTAIFLIGLQLTIWFTGNFSYLNYMSVVLSLLLISDNFLNNWFGLSPPVISPSPLILQIFTSAVGATMIFLQLISLWNYMFQPNRTFYRILNWVSPFHIANRYGIFAVMTTKRYEIVVEGSNDLEHWKEYLFKYKPSELERRPRRISPFQPRLDWQAWFLPFTSFENEIWFQAFLIRLLQGAPRVLKLLRKNPFPDNPPKYIRAVAYDYEFTCPSERKESGCWWKRKFVGVYSPTMSLKERDEVR